MAKMIHIRGRNQITLPGEVADGLGLHENDFLAVEVTQTGSIQLTPTRLVRVGTPEAEALRAETEGDVQGGRYESYASAGEMTDDLLQRARRKRAATLRERMKAFEKFAIAEALGAAQADVRKAAERLGLTPHDLEIKIKEYEIPLAASE